MKIIVAVTAAIIALAGEASAKTVCNAVDNTARILASPNPNDIHPDWRGENRVGTGQGFVAKEGRGTDVGLFVKGDLYTTRGSIMNRNVWIIAREWRCVTD